MSGATSLRESLPSPAQVRQLPCFRRATIGPDHIDAMGHMNIRWYLAFYDEAAWAFIATVGMDDAYYREQHGGAFALQHYIRYLAEVMPGDEVAVHVRVLGLSARRVHFMGFMLNETRDRLASTLEAQVAHADMTVRRISPFPPDVAARLGELRQAHDALDWQAPMSGVMAA